MASNTPHPPSRWATKSRWALRRAQHAGEVAVLVLQLAVLEQQGSKTALVVEANDTVALRSITVDERIGEFYVVKTGLKPGECVIVEGTQKVRAGMQVKPVPKAAGKAGSTGG